MKAGIALFFLIVAAGTTMEVKGNDYYSDYVGDVHDRVRDLHARDLAGAAKLRLLKAFLKENERRLLKRRLLKNNGETLDWSSVNSTDLSFRDWTLIEDNIHHWAQFLTPFPPKVQAELLIRLPWRARDLPRDFPYWRLEAAEEEFMDYLSTLPSKYFVTDEELRSELEKLEKREMRTEVLKMEEESDRVQRTRNAGIQSCDEGNMQIAAGLSALSIFSIAVMVRIFWTMVGQLKSGRKKGSFSASENVGVVC